MLRRLRRFSSITAMLLASGAFALAPAAAHPVSAQIGGNAVQALLARAQAAFDKKEYSAAQALFTQATVLAPRNAVAWAGKARSEAYLGDRADAVIDYTVAIRYAPTNAVYVLRRGISYGDLDDAQHELADYNTAIRLAPNYADAYFSRASFYYNHGQYALSIPDDTRAIQLRPFWWDAYFDRGQDENRTGQYGAAISDMTTYIKHTPRPNCGCAHTERGNAYYDLGKYVQAFADYQQAIAIGPAVNNEYYNYGKTAYILRKYAVAISALTTAITFDPTDAYAYYYRGLAYQNAGNIPAALADEQQAVHLFTQQGNTAAAQAATTVLQQLKARSS